MTPKLRPLLFSFFGILCGFFISMILVTLAGENPFIVAAVIAKSSFGSFYDLGLTLFYSTSFIFTGLSVCIALHGGLFNIGSEGQLTIGCLIATIVGILLQEMDPQFPPSLAQVLIILSGVLAGTLWGFIPGWLKSYRQSHEVIVTMMMNFIAAGMASYFILENFHSRDSQNPESIPLPDAWLWKSSEGWLGLFADSPVNISLLIAIFMCITTYFFLFKTRWGYQLRVSGANAQVAEFSGISSKKYQIAAMSLAGFFSSLVLFNEILGSAGKYRLGFSAEYGFVGIAVAMLARNNPMAILLTGFLFGALQKGASDLDIETQFITRDFAKIIQAIFILSVAGFYFLEKSTLIKKKGDSHE